MIKIKKNSKISQMKTFIMILLGILIIGIIIGTVTVINMNPVGITEISFITQGFVKSRMEQTFLQTFISSFTSSGMLILACFIAGFSSISQPFTLAVPLFRGLGLGTSVAYIYTIFGIKGFFITLLLILPHAVISSFTILIATRESIKLSNFFTSFMFLGNGDDNMKKNVKLYLLKFTILLVVIAISSIIDSIFTLFFANILL